jgi:hypothetical protein
MTARREQVDRIKDGLRQEARARATTQAAWRSSSPEERQAAVSERHAEQRQQNDR